MDWFISDTHFGHANIIKYAHRPFPSAVLMDDAIVDRWNSLVGRDDTVYHLGDFTLGGERQAHSYFIRLNGIINVLSNPWHHDGYWIYGEYTSKSGHPVRLREPVIVIEYKQYSVGLHPRAVVLCHYPQLVWDRKHYLSWHLYGHVHDTPMPDMPLAMNVCVEVTDYKPVSIEQVASRMLKEENELGLVPKERAND